MYEQTEGYGLDISNFNYCNEGFCQGILIGLEIPANPSDSASTAAMRWHSGPFYEGLQDSGSGQGIFPIGNQMLCFPTEKFV